MPNIALIRESITFFALALTWKRLFRASFVGPQCFFGLKSLRLWIPVGSHDASTLWGRGTYILGLGGIHLPVFARVVGRTLFYGWPNYGQWSKSGYCRSLVFVLSHLNKGTNQGQRLR